MKKWILILCACLFTAADAKSGGQGGNGGGGVTRDGQVLTFTSAGIRIGLEPVLNPPGQNFLSRTIEKLKIKTAHKGKLLKSMAAGGDRRYWRFSKEDMTPSVYAELIKIYRNLIGKQAPAEKIRIFAYTVGKDTYLLDEFFQLTEIGQAANLFHESLWVIDENLSYKFVNDAEAKMQKYLERQTDDYDPELYPALDELLQDWMISLIPAFQTDLANGALQGLVDPNTLAIPLADLISAEQSKLFSMDYFGDSVRKLGIHCDGHSSSENLDFDTLAYQLIKQKAEFPNSMSIRRLYEVRDRIRIKCFPEDNGGGIRYVKLPVEDSRSWLMLSHLAIGDQYLPLWVNLSQGVKDFGIWMTVKK